MIEQEKQLREKIAREITHELKICLENCACLGREAYGTYIEGMRNMILNKIKGIENNRKNEPEKE